MIGQSVSKEARKQGSKEGRNSNIELYRIILMALIELTTM